MKWINFAKIGVTHSPPPPPPHFYLELESKGHRTQTVKDTAVTSFIFELLRKNQ